jgi:hypothetical protein
MSAYVEVLESTGLHHVDRDAIPLSIKHTTLAISNRM